MLESYIWLGVVLILYFAPTFAAPAGRRGSVFVINLFFGWTLIGWAVALFVAIRAKEAAEQRAKGGA
jgi:hypothetical protein